MGRAILPIAAFVGLCVFLAIGLKLDPSRIDSPLIGKPAPTFELPSLLAPEVTVAESALNGQMWVLNVWATWCVGCRQEHDALMAIANNTDVPIYGLNWKDDSAAAKRWLQALGDPYAAVAVDVEGRVAIDWGVYGAPETFLIDAAGVVRHKHIGPITVQDWQRDFEPIIRSGS